MHAHHAAGEKRGRLGAGAQTHHVELRAARAGGAVQGDELATEEVLSRCDALWDGDGLDTAVCNELVDTPFAV